jgi:hypothetical protein
VWFYGDEGAVATGWEVLAMKLMVLALLALAILALGYFGVGLFVAMRLTAAPDRQSVEQTLQTWASTTAG